MINKFICFVFLRKEISKILVVLKINERTKTLVGRNNLGENTIKRKYEIILKNFIDTF